MKVYLLLLSFCVICQLQAQEQDNSKAELAARVVKSYNTMMKTEKQVKPLYYKAHQALTRADKQLLHQHRQNVLTHLDWREQLEKKLNKNNGLDSFSLKVLKVNGALARKIFIEAVHYIAPEKPPQEALALLVAACSKAYLALYSGYNRKTYTLEYQRTTAKKVLLLAIDSFEGGRAGRPKNPSHQELLHYIETGSW